MNKTDKFYEDLRIEQRIIAKALLGDESWILLHKVLKKTKEIKIIN